MAFKGGSLLPNLRYSPCAVNFTVQVDRSPGGPLNHFTQSPNSMLEHRGPKRRPVGSVHVSGLSACFCLLCLLLTQLKLLSLAVLHCLGSLTLSSLTSNQPTSSVILSVPVMPMLSSNDFANTFPQIFLQQRKTRK